MPLPGVSTKDYADWTTKRRLRRWEADETTHENLVQWEGDEVEHRMDLDEARSAPPPDRPDPPSPALSAPLPPPPPLPTPAPDIDATIAEAREMDAARARPAPPSTPTEQPLPRPPPLPATRTPLAVPTEFEGIVNEAREMDRQAARGRGGPAPAAPRPTPATGPVGRGGDLRAYARQAATQAGIDPDEFERQIQQESGFDPRAGSGAGARGIAQIMPQFHTVDVNDPYASLDYAARLMRTYNDQYGDPRVALAAYNAGPGAVAKYGGIPPFEETQRYVRIVHDEPRARGAAPAQATPPAMPEAQPTTTPTATARADIRQRAEGYVGTPYLWGGADKQGIDCSAFISRAWGVDRQTTDTLARVASPIEKDALQPGDALNLTTGQDPRGYGHVRMFDGWADPDHRTMYVYESSTATGGVARRVIPYDAAYTPMRLNALTGEAPDETRDRMHAEAPPRQAEQTPTGRPENTPIQPEVRTESDRPPSEFEPPTRYGPPAPEPDGGVVGRAWGPPPPPHTPPESLPTPQMRVPDQGQPPPDPWHRVGQALGDAFKQAIGGIGQAVTPPEPPAPWTPSPSGSTFGAPAVTQRPRQPFQQDVGQAAEAIRPRPGTGGMQAPGLVVAPSRLREHPEALQQLPGDQPLTGWDIAEAAQGGQQTVFSALRAAWNRDPALYDEYSQRVMTTQPPGGIGPPTQPMKFSEILGDMGMPDGEARELLGEFGDLTIDPNNLIGVGEALKAPAIARFAERFGPRVARIAAAKGMNERAVEAALSRAPGAPGVVADALTGARSFPMTMREMGDFYRRAAAETIAGGAFGVAGGRAGEAIDQALGGDEHGPWGKIGGTLAGAITGVTGLGRSGSRLRIGSAAAALERGLEAAPRAVGRGLEAMAEMGPQVASAQLGITAPRISERQRARPLLRGPDAEYEANLDPQTRETIVQERARLAAQDRMAQAELRGFGRRLEGLAPGPQPPTGMETLAEAERRARGIRTRGLGPTQRAAEGRATAEYFEMQVDASGPLGEIPEAHPYSPEHVLKEYDTPGTVERTTESVLRRYAAQDPDQLPRLDPVDYRASIPYAPRPQATSGPRYPISVLGRARSMDDLRTAIEVGRRGVGWYPEFARFLRAAVGEERMNELSVVFGVTSGQTPVGDNVAQTFWAMREAQDIAESAQRTGKTLTAADYADEFKKRADGIKTYYAPWMKTWTDTKANKLGELYAEGFATSGGAKTPSYAGNILSALAGVFDPNSTNDTWILRDIFGYAAKDAAGKSDGVYRSVGAVVNWLAREYGITVQDAQAALWVAGRNLKNRAPKLARQVASGKMDLATALRAAETEGVYAFGGNLDEVLQNTGAMEQLDAFTRASGAITPSPGMSAEARLEYLGQGPTPRPVSGARTAEAQAAIRENAPVVNISSKPGSTPELSATRAGGLHQGLVQDARFYNPDTNRITILDEMDINHEVIRTTKWSTYYGRPEPSLSVRIFGNRSEARRAAAAIGESWQQKEVGISMPVHGTGTPAGYKLEHPEGRPFSEAEQLDFARRAGARGLETDVDASGAMLFPDYAGEGEPYLIRVIQLVENRGYYGRALGTYTGFSETVAKADYASILDRAARRSRLTSGGRGLPFWRDRLGSIYRGQAERRGILPQGETGIRGGATAFDYPDPAQFDPNGLGGPTYNITLGPGREAVSDWYANLRAGEKLGQGMRRSPTDFTPTEGAQVRGVVMPSDPRLLPLYGKVPTPELTNIIDTVPWQTDQGERLRRQMTSGFGVQGEDVQRALIRDGVATDARSANTILAGFGYDGWQYSGTRHVPVTDPATGIAAQHQVVAIFPEAMRRLRNAITDEPYGITAGGGLGRAGLSRPGVPEAVAGTAAGVDEALSTADDEEMSPAERVLRIGGAAAGTAASLNLLRSATRGARAGARRAAEIVPPEYAARQPGPIDMPADPRVILAIQGTPGASITRRGLEMLLHRFQKITQPGAEVGTKGIFYRAGPRQSSAYEVPAGYEAGYGGSQRIEGPTLFRRPFITMTAHDSGAAEEALAKFLGRTDGEQAVRESSTLSYDLIGGGGFTNDLPDPSAATTQIADYLRRHGGDPASASVIDAGARKAVGGGEADPQDYSSRVYHAALQNVAGELARKNGYDAIIGYSPYDNRLSEVFDIRERVYPGPGGEFEVHPEFQPPPTPSQPRLPGLAAVAGRAAEGAWRDPGAGLPEAVGAAGGVAAEVAFGEGQREGETDAQYLRRRFRAAAGRAFGGAALAATARGRTPARLLGQSAEEAERIVPPAYARQQPGGVRIPAQPGSGVPHEMPELAGVRITPDGAEIDLTRFQKLIQQGKQAVRGVFYGRTTSEPSFYERAGPSDVGGPQRVTGPTILRRPLYVEGVSFADAEQIRFGPDDGLSRMEKKILDRDAQRTSRAFHQGGDVGEIADYLARNGADPADADALAQVHIGDMDLALVDAVLVDRARRAGYDSVIVGNSYTPGRVQPTGVVGTRGFVVEIVDLRESVYPGPSGEFEVRPEFRPPGGVTLAAGREAVGAVGGAASELVTGEPQQPGESDAAYQARRLGSMGRRALAGAGIAATTRPGVRRAIREFGGARQELGLLPPGPGRPGRGGLEPDLGVGRGRASLETPSAAALPPISATGPPARDLTAFSRETRDPDGVRGFARSLPASGSAKAQLRGLVADALDQRLGAGEDEAALRGVAERVFGKPVSQWIKSGAGTSYDEVEATALGVALDTHQARYQQALQDYDNTPPRQTSPAQTEEIASAALDIAALVAARDGRLVEAANRAKRSLAAEGLDPADAAQATERALANFGGDNVSFAAWASKQNKIEQAVAAGTMTPEVAQRARYNLYRQAIRSTAWEKLDAWRYASMLSNPRTHLANIAGNLGETVSRPAELALSGQFRAAGKDVRATLGALPRAFDLATQAFQEGATSQQIAGATRFERLRARPFGEGLLPEAVPGSGSRLDRLAGRVVETPLNALAASDEFFRAINHAGALHSEAWKMAGGNAAKAEDLMRTKPPELMNRVAEVAKRAVYGEDPGAIVEAISKARYSGPAGRIALGFVLPFVKTPANIYKRGGAMVLRGLDPTLVGVGAVEYLGRRTGRFGFEKVDEATARQTAVGRNLMAKMVAGTAAYIATQDALSGDGPSDKNKRDALIAQGWQPNSVKIGGTWISYRNAGPAAVPLSLIANAWEGYKEGQKPGQDLAGDVLRRLGHTVVNTSYLRGLSDVVKAVETGAVGPGVQNFLAGSATSLLPASGALGAVERVVDPEMRTRGNVLEQVQGRIPGLSSGLEPESDVYGRPRVQGAPDASLGERIAREIFPFQSQRERANDPVANEVARLAQGQSEVDFGALARREPGAVRITPGQNVGLRRFGRQYAGTEQAPAAQRAIQTEMGRAAYTYLASRIADPAYQALPDTRKAADLKDAVGVAYQLNDLLMGERIQRDERHSALLALQSVPLYEGMPRNLSVEQIREQNFRIAKAQAKLADYRQSYGRDQGEQRLLREDRASYLLADRYRRLRPEDMAAIRDRIDRRYNGALTRLERQGLPGTAQTVLGTTDFGPEPPTRP